LRCSFCGAAWRLAADQCIYCHAGGPAFLTAAPDPSRPVERLELCQACGGYLKAMDRPRRTPFALLSVEDLATSDLDLVAAEQGYARPALRTVDD